MIRSRVQLEMGDNAFRIDTLSARLHYLHHFSLRMLTSIHSVVDVSIHSLLQTIIFKHNPYFFGDFGDRITSYVPVYELDGAILNSNKATYRLSAREEVECK